MFVSFDIQHKDWFKCNSTSIACVASVTWFYIMTPMIAHSKFSIGVKAHNLDSQLTDPKRDITYSLNSLQSKLSWLTSVPNHARSVKNKWAIIKQPANHSLKIRNFSGQAYKEYYTVLSLTCLLSPAYLYINSYFLFKNSIVCHRYREYKIKLTGRNLHLDWAIQLMLGNFLSKFFNKLVRWVSVVCPI